VLPDGDTLDRTTDRRERERLIRAAVDAALSANGAMTSSAPATAASHSSALAQAAKPGPAAVGATVDTVVYGA
jgi:hypothetical protein